MRLRVIANLIGTATIKDRCDRTRRFSTHPARRSAVLERAWSDSLGIAPDISSAYAAAVAVELSPPELAHLVEFSERPRTHDWSLRSALVRYAQPQPARVEAVLDLTRRLEFAIGKHNKVLAKQGEEVWSAIKSGADGDDSIKDVVALLRVAQEIDALGDVLAAWAVDRTGARPDAAVDTLIGQVAPELDALGVPHEERPRPPRGRG